jgi:hypothetical protein
MNLTRFLPRFIRQSLYLALVSELQSITDQNVASFAAKVLAAARKVLAL